jgi:hypothetical protein
VPDVIHSHDRNNAPNSETEIAKFWANRIGKTIIIKPIEYDGRMFVDARRHFTDPKGRLSATPKGRMLPIRKLPDLTIALLKAEDKARTQDLLDGSGE